MNWVSGFVLYAIIWWTVLFMVLPWGSVPPDQAEIGHATSAPAQPRLVRKFAVTTLIAAFVWIIAYALIAFELFSFRDWANRLPG